MHDACVSAEKRGTTPQTNASVDLGSAMCRFEFGDVHSAPPPSPQIRIGTEAGEGGGIGPGARGVDPPQLPTGLNIFAAEGAGYFFCITKAQTWLTLLLINRGHSAKGNPKQKNVWQHPCPQ